MDPLPGLPFDPAALAKLPITDRGRLYAELGLNRLQIACAEDAVRAVKLGEYEVFFGDARTVVRDLEAYLAVTPADVKRVAAEYLLPERRVVVEVRPRAAGGAKP